MRADLQEYARHAKEYLTAADEASRRLALSCLEKTVIISSCRDSPPGATFVKLLRQKDKQAVAEFEERLKNLNAALKVPSQSRIREPSAPERRQTQIRTSDVDYARQERRRLDPRQISSQQTDQRNVESYASRHAAITEVTGDSMPQRAGTLGPAGRQARGSSRRLDETSYEEPSEQMQSYEPRRSAERFSDDEEDRYPASRSRHSVASVRRPEQITSKSRNTEEVTVDQEGFAGRPSTLPFRAASHRSGLPSSTQDDGVSIDTATQSSTAIRRHDGGQSNQSGRGRGSGATGPVQGPSSFPSRRPDQPASFRAGGAPTDPAFQNIPPHRWNDYFRRGRVFAVLQHLPNTNRNAPPVRDTASERNSVRVATDQYGDRIYTSIRRMIVVGRSRGFCWAIPISTYGGRGLNKPGLSAVNIQAHAIVHMSDTAPYWLDGEPRSTKRPIAVHPENNQQLRPSSRLNFEKIHTVEMNMPVLRIGTVSDSSLPFLTDYFQQEMRRVAG